MIRIISEQRAINCSGDAVLEMTGTDASEAGLRSGITGLLRGPGGKDAKNVTIAMGPVTGDLPVEGIAEIVLGEVRRNLLLHNHVVRVRLFSRDPLMAEALGLAARRDAVLCLGDSITYGFPYGTEASWATLLKRELKLNIVNRGLNGDTTGGMCQRLRTDIRMKPAFVHIMGGANDAWMGYKLSRVSANFTFLVEEALKHGVCPVVGLPAPFSPDSDPGGFDHDLAHVAALNEYRDWMREYVLQREIPHIDYYSAFIDTATGGVRRDYFFDFAHPNIEGYRAMAGVARNMFARIASVMTSA